VHRMLRLVIVRRLAWTLADLGIMRGRIEEAFKRHLIVPAPDGEKIEPFGFVEESAFDTQTLPKANSTR
jgi:hypothetical protein